MTIMVESHLASVASLTSPRRCRQLLSDGAREVAVLRLGELGWSSIWAAFRWAFACHAAFGLSQTVFAVSKKDAVQAVDQNSKSAWELIRTRNSSNSRSATSGKKSVAMAV
jgi:hypothetical protein